MRYWPNPAHKRETTEAGPPRWHPDKSACPPMGLEERNRPFRRRSGAFAAELLLPEAALRRASGDALDRGAEPEVFERLMEVYGVGARTAAHQMYNHQLLSSSEVRDQLIEDHAAR